MNKDKDNLEKHILARNEKAIDGDISTFVVVIAVVL